jgi:zinc protease
MKLRVSTYTLENGLRVIMNEDPYSTMVASCIVYLVGSRTEREGITGISHVLEHLMFKGTDRISPEDYSKRIQKIGGYDNAYTSKDYTAYYAYLPVEGLETFLELEADRMVNLKIRDFEEEMEVIKDERRYTTQDNPVEAFMEEFWLRLFEKHPYRFPVIGFMEDLEKMTIEKVLEYYNKFYTPPNVILSISGNVNEGKTLELVKKYFSDISKDGMSSFSHSSEPEQKEKRFFKIKKKKVTPLIVLGFKTVPLDSELTPVFEVLGEMLCGGKWGVLVSDLVYDKRIFASVQCDSSHLMEAGVFSIVGVPSPGRDVFDSYKILEEKLLEATSKFNEEFLVTARNKILADFYFNIESVRDVVFDLVEFEMGGGAGLINEYPDAIKRVSMEDVKKAMESYIREELLTVGVLYG